MSGIGVDTEPTSSAGDDAPSLARSTTAIGAWNLVSRITGFGRALAMGAALGATALGDTFQAANLVSNILFELLAGGVLSAVLVPAFVQRIARGDGDATQLAGRVLGVACAVLGVITVVGMVASPAIMRALTVGVDDGRDARVELGAFLLLFVLPQLVLYAVGAVATALLQANHKFVAAAAAPIAGNVVLIATMLLFRSLQDGRTGLVDAGSRPAFVLGVGTLAAVAAMTVVPVIALRRAGHRLLPRWPGTAERGELRTLVGRGVWAAGHVGSHQLLILATIVLAARVAGGVVATQIALTFFLLPHAVLANPVFTARFPRFAADAAAGRLDALAADVCGGLRSIALLVAPAAALLAALAEPGLRLVRLGALDEDGALLVAGVLAAEAAGLLGYSASFLLTRAAYAMDDVRTPTVVALACAAAGVVGMAVASSAVDGDTKVVVLGAAFAVTHTVTAVVLLRAVVARVGRPVLPVGAVARAVAGSVVAGVVAAVVAGAVDGGGRTGAAAALVAGGAAGLASYAGVLKLAGTP
jgi:putative peptidoglycan lipid II flippase